MLLMRRVCALLALALCTSNVTSCIWLDDFGKFKIGDAGNTDREFPDAQTGRPQTDAAQSDAAVDAAAAAASERCSHQDCTSLTSICAKGVCNPKTGECEALKLTDGTSCFDGNPCTFGDTCQDAKCVGQPLDCSALNDECSNGVCDPETGGCKFGPNRASKPCDDANACTINDRCTDDPKARCRGDNAPAGAKCSDFESCSGTDAEPDACDGNGLCTSGAPISVGTDCNDDDECTESDKCNDQGICRGNPIREGEACQGDCTSNTTCQHGDCLPKTDSDAPTYNPQCLTSFCGISNICLDRWKSDLTCQCGCGYKDSACNACSPYMCSNHDDHKAARWCDKDGKSLPNCPDSLKGDGKCDCGCQFADPDCNGGGCCSGTGKKGCGNSYVEECVCQNLANGDADCCNKSWTDRCAKLAVNLGCMLCPEP